MYVWELVSCRLRGDGWQVWHTTRNDAYGPTYTVHLQRPGIEHDVSGPTLTEAYAAAARRVRDPMRRKAGHHLSRLTAMARA